MEGKGSKLLTTGWGEGVQIVFCPKFHSTDPLWCLRPHL